MIVIKGLSLIRTNTRTLKQGKRNSNHVVNQSTYSDRTKSIMYGNGQKYFIMIFAILLHIYHLDSIHTIRFLEIRISVNSAMSPPKECEMNRKVSLKENHTHT